MTTIDPTTIKRNSWTENLGSDVIAVDALGNVLARASDCESVARAAPDHVAIFGAADLEPAKAPKVKEKHDEPLVENKGFGLTEAVKEAPAPIAATDTEAHNDSGPLPPKTKNPFDHDGDGANGGSKAGEESTAAVGAARKRKPAKGE